MKGMLRLDIIVLKDWYSSGLFLMGRGLLFPGFWSRRSVRKSCRGWIGKTWKDSRSKGKWTLGNRNWRIGNERYQTLRWCWSDTTPLTFRLSYKSSNFNNTMRARNAPITEITPSVELPYCPRLYHAFNQLLPIAVLRNVTYCPLPWTSALTTTFSQPPVYITNQ